MVAAPEFAFADAKRRDVDERISDFGGPGALACSLGMVKNVVWSLAWPLWWTKYATDFSLLHAVLGR